MAIKEREYMVSINAFKRPEIKKDQQAICMLLLRLLLLEPGSDPLHPEMGVGITRYRYGMNTLEELRKRIADQLNTYLPCFPSSRVEIEITGDHLLTVYITINDVIYVYDSEETGIPITLEDVRSNKV